MRIDSLTDKIIDFESGNMAEHEVAAFFQELIDTGMVWQLQGSYGRMAVALIEAGVCAETREE